MLLSTFSIAQIDSLVFKNGDVVAGEIKELDKGILKVETDYSDDDFTIEWLGVREIYTRSTFVVSTSDGTRYSGKLRSVGDGYVIIYSDTTNTVRVLKKEIVYMKDLDKGFWGRFYASFDVGLDLTKANNYSQLSIRSNFGYFAERWSADVTFSEVNSTQDDVDPIERTDGALTFRYLLPRDWFTVGSISFLSNTEQKLDLRTNGKLGMGKYVIHTNRQYWGFSAGASFNNEKFKTEESASQSLEGFFGTELNLYDIGDLNLLTVATAYPSFTDSGRWRGDFKFDMKYDLPLDFYIRLGFTLNYDNQPVEGASETDYVIQSGFGWEL